MDLLFLEQRRHGLFLYARKDMFF